MFRSQNVLRDYNNKKNWHEALEQFDVPNAANTQKIRSNFSNAKPGSIVKWAPRLLVLTGCVAVMGNIPLQSKPNTQASDSLIAKAQTEDIKEAKSSLLQTPSASEPVLLASVIKEDSIDKQNLNKATEIDDETALADEDIIKVDSVADTSIIKVETSKPEKVTSVELKTTTEDSKQAQLEPAQIENIISASLVSEPTEEIKLLSGEIYAPKEEPIKVVHEGESVELKPGESITLTQKLTLPPASSIETFSASKAADKLALNNSEWSTYVVKPKDGIKKVSRKLKIRSYMSDLSKNNDIKRRFDRIKAGYILRAKKQNGKLSELVIHRPGNKKSYVIKNTDKGYKGQFKNKIIEVRQSREVIYITNSWRFNANKAQLPTSLINQINDIFDRDVNLSKDLAKGDRVTLVYEEVFHKGEKVAVSSILGAELVHEGRKHRAIRFVSNDGRANYYTPKGMDLNRAFIRHPVAYPRVTSRFSYRRFHPILKRYRPHTGVDYGLPRGTPVKTTGNGIVKFVGRKGGYGKTIIVQHNNGYTTSYSHLRGYKKGIRTGKKVYLGDVIGYVGNTGRSTGPHLHFEFRKNGKPFNPLSVKLPRTLSLDSTNLAKFKNDSRNLVLQLNVLQRFAEAELDITSGFGG